jgi:hypothetical protein
VARARRQGAGFRAPIDLDTMLKLTAAARFDGGKFEGVDLFLADPHTSIDSTKEDIQRLVDEIAGYGLAALSRLARKDGFDGWGRFANRLNLLSPASPWR